MKSFNLSEVTKKMNNTINKPKLAVLENDLIKITFQYNPDMIAKVKTLLFTGRDGRWNPEKKFWRVDIDTKSIYLLRSWGFEISNELLNLEKKLLNPVKEFQPIKIEGLKKELYPFQNEGVAFIESRNGRVLLADSMGLGKTIQALAYLQLHPELRPAIVICPASLKLNWQREIETTITKRNKTEVLSGRNGADNPCLNLIYM